MSCRLFVIPLIVTSLLIAGCRKSPISGRYVGRTKAQVLSTLGNPDSQWDGHYGNPPVSYTRQFSGKVESLTYKRDGGLQYLSFEQRGDSWVCISSDWLPDGVVF